MVVIDSRLKTCDTDQDVAENFNRTLALVYAGGGSSGTPVIIVNENNDVLDIKPSDVIDENGQMLNKYFVLKVHNVLSGGDNFLPIYVVNNMQGQVGIAFGDSQTVQQNLYVASIEDDDYFTYQESN